MQNESKTRGQLIQEIEALRQRMAELEAAQTESVQRYEATLRGLLQRVPLGVHLYDLRSDGRLVFVGANPAADRILGVDNAQFIGQTIEEAFPPLVETEVPVRYRRAAVEGIPWEVDQIAYEDGTVAGTYQVYAFQIWPGSVAVLFLDVTERKRLETQLRQANDRLERQLRFTEALLAAVPTPVFFKDAQGRYLGCNDAFTEQMGVSAGEMKGKTVHDLWPSEHAEVYHRKDLELMQHPQHQVYEFQVRDKTGRDRDVIFAKNAFHDETGQVAGLVGAYTDITERKQAEEGQRLALARALQATQALQESEERLRRVVEHMPVMMDALDEDYNILVWNRECERVTGYSAAEMVGNPRALEMLYPNAQYRAQMIVESVDLGFDFRDKEWTLTCKDGTRKTISWSNIAARFPVPGWHTWAIGVDITERKRAEQTLVRLSNAVRMSTDSIVISDLEGKIVDVNEATLGMYGTDNAEDLVGKSSFDLIALEEREKALADMREVQKSGYVRSQEYHVIAQDGSRIPMEISVAIMQDADGKPIGFVGVSRDIAERKRAEEALRESEEKYRSLVEQSNDAIYLLYDNRFELINPRFEALFGVTAEEVRAPGFSFMSLVAPQSRPLVEERLRKLAQRQELDPRYEFTAQDREGNEFEVEVSVSYIPYRDGTAVQGILRDISQRMQAQRALRQERDLSRALADAAAAVSRTLDPDEVLGRLLEQVSRVIPNDAANVMLFEGGDRVCIARWQGYERFGAEAFVSTAVFDLDAMPNLRQMVESGEPVAIADTRTHPDWVQVPEQAWVRSYAGAPIRVRGEIVGFLNVDSATPGFFTPLHANTLRAFADHAAMALQNAQLYQERVRAGRLFSALNRAALSITRATTTGEIFGAAAGELRPLGLTCAVLMMDEDKRHLHPVYVGQEASQNAVLEEPTGLDRPRFVISLQAIQDDWQALLDRQAMLIEDTEGMLLGTACRSAGDVVRRLSISKAIVATLLVEEQAIGLFLVQGKSLTQDDVPAITAFAHQVAAAWHKADLMQSLQRSLDELRRTQAQLVQAQKMEAIGRLAGGVAHDFNNYLTAIQGYAEMVLLELDPQDPRREDVREIQRAAERSVELTRQLLAFSRKQVIQPRVLDLNSLIGTMRKILDRLIGEDIELRIMLTSELGQVEADPGQIEQVVMNMVINARDAIDEKTGSQAAPFVACLTIETANVELDEAYVHDRVEVEPGPYVMLAVSDNGIGMDEETMSHLFEPFFTTKEQGRGTGLGLAMVYGIVKQNGGYVFPHSEPGVGTTFRVYLPRIEADASAEVQIRMPAAAARGSETILLVEDEDAVRALARRILVGRGYRVLEAANADDALRLCERHAEPIHLLLTDVVVPGLLSSMELVDRIVKARPDIEVIYMSGYTDDVIAHHGVLDPGIQFVEKPFTPNALALKVREVLDNTIPAAETRR